MRYNQILLFLFFLGFFIWGCKEAGYLEIIDEYQYLFEDNDGDGVTEIDGDCDDEDATIYPGALDVADDGIDRDCDGLIDEFTIYFLQSLIECPCGLVIYKENEDKWYLAEDNLPPWEINLALGRNFLNVLLLDGNGNFLWAITDPDNILGIVKVKNASDEEIASTENREDITGFSEGYWLLVEVSKLRQTNF